MGFWSNLFKNKAQTVKEETPVAIEQVLNIQQNTEMACELNLCGEKYLLTDFDLRFNRDDNQCKFFEMHFAVENGLNNNIESWIASSSRKENGSIRFYRDTNVVNEGTLFELSFQNASCMRIKKRFNNTLPVTNLVLAIPSIKMAGEEFDLN